MAKQTKGGAKAPSSGRKLAVKKQPVKDVATKQAKNVRGGATLRRLG